MTEHQVVVVFDISAESQEEAAQILVHALDVRGGVGKVVVDDIAAGGAVLESWWLPEAHLKHLDGNDNGPMHLEPDDLPQELYVEDDAEDEPTVWAHDPTRPDSPVALLRCCDVTPQLFNVRPSARPDLEHAVDSLWEHIVRGLPTGPPSPGASS